MEPLSQAALVVSELYLSQITTVICLESSLAGCRHKKTQAPNTCTANTCEAKLKL
jgi:hypothetical protein